MSQRRISILARLTGMSITTAILAVVMLGYTLYHYQFVADQFDNLVSYTAEKTLDIGDSQTDFAGIVADIQEIFAYEDISLVSVTGINQRNLQAADDEWEAIYKYADEFQGK